MATTHTTFGPLVEIPSTFLTVVQLGIFTQRGQGYSNSLVSTLDTVSPQVSIKSIIFACDSSNLNPPIFGGLIDNSMDWRDRHITAEIEFDTEFSDSRDIRWGHGQDNKQALEQFMGPLYTRTGGNLLSISIKDRVCLYVDSTNGYLWIKKSPGIYLRGKITSTVQTKERS